MLKITLQRGSNLDRHLESVARSYSRCSEKSIEYGVLRVTSYPSLDPLIASFLVMAYSLTTGVRASLKVAYKPPSVIDKPTLLLGYPSLNYTSSNIKECLIAYTYEGRLGTPPPGALFVESSGSITSAVTLTLLVAGWRASDDLKVLSLLGTYASRYVDRLGRIHGLDSLLVESLSDLGITMATTVKVYRPSSKPLCEAIAETVDPYYPSLTGDPGVCVSLLEASKLGDLSTRLPDTLSRDELTKLADALMEYINRYSRSPPDLSWYLGGVLVSPERQPESPKMALDAILAGMEALNDYTVGLAAFIDFSNEYPVLESNLNRIARYIGDDVAKSRPRRVRGPGWLRLYLVDEPNTRSLTLLYRALRITGIVEPESVLVVEEEGEYRASPLQVEEALGYGGVKKLVDSRVARMEDFKLSIEAAER